MRILCGVAVLAALFEAVSSVPNGREDGVGAGLVTAAFAVVFLLCAWALRARGSMTATAILAVFLLVDVAGVPFYAKNGWQDWVVQLGFAALGIVGLVACVNVVRDRRPRITA
jgi:hypothetical protein